MSAEDIYAEVVRAALAALGDDEPSDAEDMARRLERARAIMAAAMTQIEDGG